MVRLLGSACVYGQVLKTRRNNRVVRVERRVKIGTASRLNAALLASEDAETLNTSFIERLNLTIRQGSAYLRRRSPCHARGADQLRGHVELLRGYYNFIRPHRALRFGRETRTPAMQAGLVSQRLALRDIFTAGGSVIHFLACEFEVARSHARDALRCARGSGHARTRMAATATLGLLELHLGNLESADMHLGETLALSDRFSVSQISLLDSYAQWRLSLVSVA